MIQKRLPRILFKTNKYQFCSTALKIDAHNWRLILDVINKSVNDVINSWNNNVQVST